MEYKDIKTLDMLAFSLGIPVKQLTGLLYGVKIENCYSSFVIKKKNGDDRTINAPNKSLKYVQRKLARLFVERQKEFFLEKNVKNNISHAFFKGKGIKTNAIPHRNKKYVLNLDLENFFGSIHFGRVQGFFKKNTYFKLPEIATIIAQLTCYEGSLPQGAPTSPIISNLICQILDQRILSLCKRFRLTYTRYADDLTFSTNDNNFKKNYTEFLEELEIIIIHSGFNVNSKKTHFQEYNGRQLVTGLSVNKKINVKKEFYKKTRSMAHTLYKTGKFTINGAEGTINQLEGRFSFINDLVKYNNRLEELNSLNHNSIVHKKNLLFTKGKNFEVKTREKKQTLKWEENLENLNIREKDYQKFLFYKYFLANPKITIITEGKTDSKYIKAALRRYHTEYPNLVYRDSHGFKYNIHFLRRSKRIRYFFGSQQEGANELESLIDYFVDKDNEKKQNYIKYFKNIWSDTYYPQKPTIFLFDNEWGGSPLHKISSNLAKINGLRTNDFLEKIHSDFLYHIDLNAFLMTLPVTDKDIKTKTKIEIENLLNIEEINNKLIAQEYDNKIFDPNKKHGDTTKIGKEIFANCILSNYNSEVINFSNIKPLLNLINDLSEDYKQVIKRL